MLLKKRGIHLTEEKISVVKARAGSSKTVWELLLKEYKGLKIKERWVMNYLMVSRSFKLILGNGKKIKLGSYSTKEIELLQDTIANHIQENASL